jgi:hypothetical protein
MKRYIQGIMTEFEQIEPEGSLKEFLHLQAIIYFKLEMERWKRFRNEGLVTSMQLLQNFYSLRREHDQIYFLQFPFLQLE